MYTRVISILLFASCVALVVETHGQQRGVTEPVTAGTLPPAVDTLPSHRGGDSLREAISEDLVPAAGNDSPASIGREASMSAVFSASVPMMSMTDRLRGGVPSTAGSTAGAPWQPRIGLVLSGGGARGIAQVGVLRALEEAGIRPDFIVGTSIGSIIGGLYASGYNARRLETTIREIDWSSALRLSDEADRNVLSVDQKTMSDRSILTLRFDGLQPVIPQAVSKGQRLTNLLNELTLQGVYHAEDFDRLGIPFRAVATDLHTGRSVVLRDGSLAECLRASSTIPVMYAAVRRDSMLLVDGGLLANIPTEVAVDAGCDFIIAVNTTSPMRSVGNMETALEIVDQILNVVMIPHSEVQLELADVVIAPKLGSILGTDFAMADSLIRLGYEAGRSATEQLRRRLNNAAVARMERPPQQLASYQPRPISDEQSDDPWFARPQALDDIYHKAVLTAQDDRYSDVNVQLDARDGSATIRAGRTQRITSVRVTGNTLLPMAVIVGIETRWTGASVSADVERELTEYILEDYRSRGYSLARIDSIAIDRYGKVFVRVDEGVVGRITVSGNTRTNPVVILRELPLREGAIFRLSDMKRGMDNLLALNLFHHVAYDMREYDGRTDIVIRVVERPSQELQTGLLVDNERNAQIGLQLRDANLLGTGTELAASFFSGQSNREYALRYSTNRMFYTPFSMQLRGHYGFRDYNNYENVRDLPEHRFDREVTFVYRRISYGASASFGLDVQRFGNVLGGLRIEQQQIRTDQVRTLTAERISEDHRLVELSLSSTIDTQDRYPYPRNGVRFTAEYASAQTALGSEATFTRLQAEYEFFVPVIPDILVAHPRFLFGYGDKTMPRTEEFRLGGLYSFMGMRENEFNGRQIALVSLELRYTSPLRILFDTYFSVRYDLGRTWLNPELIKLGDLRHGVGMQIGLDTPIGPADFGIGRSFYFLRNNPDRTVKLGALNLYFSIGARL